MDTESAEIAAGGRSQAAPRSGSRCARRVRDSSIARDCGNAFIRLPIGDPDRASAPGIGQSARFSGSLPTGSQNRLGTRAIPQTDSARSSGNGMLASTRASSRSTTYSVAGPWVPTRNRDPPRCRSPRGKRLFPGSVIDCSIMPVRRLTAKIVFRGLSFTATHSPTETASWDGVPADELRMTRRACGPRSSGRRSSSRSAQVQSRAAGRSFASPTAPGVTSSARPWGSPDPKLPGAGAPRRAPMARASPPSPTRSARRSARDAAQARRVVVVCGGDRA